MRRLGKSVPGAPGVPMLGQSRGITGKRSVNRLMKRDEAKGITQPEADALIKPFTPATLTTALAGANNDLVFSAKKLGLSGNNITVTYVDPGGATAVLGVVVTVNAIVVNLGRTASAIDTTAALLKAAIEASGPANALVSVANAPGNSGAGLVTAMSIQSLTGGYTPIPVAAGAGLGGPTAGSSVSKRSRTTPSGSGQSRPTNESQNKSLRRR